MKTTILLPLVLLTIAGTKTQAQTYVGTIVAKKGEVKILRSPSENSSGPFALFDGQKFSYEKGKIGKKVRPGEVVQTGTNGKVKIAYPNGDHFLLGTGTSMRLPEISDKNKTKKNSTIKLLYGRMRALVSKKGPRRKLKVKTPSAVAGVRGTDFFTRANHEVGTQLTVLRGEVRVASKAAPKVVTRVKTGYSVETSAKTKKPPKVSESTKEELIKLQAEADLEASKKDLQGLSKKVKKEIKKLEATSKNAVLEDIKEEDPSLYKELKKKENIKTSEINTAVVAKLYKMAPSQPKKKKPTRDEIDAIGTDVYEKYFKNSN